MKIDFEKMSAEHGRDIMDIFNYYIGYGFAAYPDKELPYEFYDKFLEATTGYPAFSVMAEGKTIGFCFLRAYNPFPTFKECAEITYYIDKDFTGKGIGNIVLNKLESEARKMGIKTILASIASENPQSIVFHKKNGFRRCGRFMKIINKKGKQYDLIWMQKMIS